MKNGLPYEHVVSISGGVDSGAALLKAIERGRPFVAVFADTGNEHEAVYEHIDYLERETGVQVRRVRASFDAKIAAKRAYVAERWPGDGVPQYLVDRAVAALVPTGNPFLDLCIWKTRFPGAKSRFCTEELKVKPLFLQAQKPILDEGRAVISWQGVRADESASRALLPKWQRLGPPYDMKFTDEEAAAAERWRMYAYRPLIDWTKDRCFDMYRRHGLRWNRLYDLGFERVGCMLCIMAKKLEVRLAAKLFPEHIARLEEWEQIVTDVSKRGCATFFCVADDPTWDGQGITRENFGIRARVEWAKTSRGGRQYDMESMIDFNTPCNQWGACEH